MHEYHKCYELGREIIIAYYELINLLRINRKNCFDYEWDIQKIKRLIIDEYDTISKMSKEKIIEYLKKIEQIAEKDKTDVHERLKRRLMSYLDVKENNFLNLSEFTSVNISKNINFGLFDVIVSMIKINTLKKVKEKIGALAPTNDQDESFTEALKAEFDISAIVVTSMFSVGELITINSNMEIDDIPEINITNIANKVNLLFPEIEKETRISAFDSTILSFAKNCIVRLSTISNIYNNPTDIYQHLYRVTELEICISYMNQNTLEKLSEYCDLIKHSNPTIEKNIKKLIREKTETKKGGSQ